MKRKPRAETEVEATAETLLIMLLEVINQFNRNATIRACCGKIFVYNERLINIIVVEVGCFKCNISMIL